MLARINKQRPSREDETLSKMKKLNTRGVKSLEVRYKLDNDGEAIEYQSKIGMYLNEKNSIIYIDTTKFNLRNRNTLFGDTSFQASLSIQLEYYFDIDSGR